MSKRMIMCIKRQMGFYQYTIRKQDAVQDYWRIGVPDNKEIRDQVVGELHSIPYSAHPGIQRTIGKIRKSFFWKGMSGHVREFVENCRVCQVEKSDHTLRANCSLFPFLRVSGMKCQLISLLIYLCLPETVTVCQ